MKDFQLILSVGTFDTFIEINIAPFRWGLNWIWLSYKEVLYKRLMIVIGPLKFIFGWNAL